MQEVENCSPPWLKLLLEANFFVDYQTHGHYKYMQCNHYCIECTGNPFCSYCLDDHKNHQIIQMRRSSLSNDVRVDDIRKHINVGAIQPYMINKRQITFLNSRPYIGLPCGVTNICNICRRSLPAANFEFCSLSCKHEAIYRGFPKQTFALETKLSTCEVDDSFQIYQSSTPKGN
ncbi:hypothetical protein RHSIM_Rhsim11G0018100 [Rhododendron simsii]|uniref:PLATZ transcription factor family protein n=1 Tax=Rhododendron simsii TaxID=118357 RepID=A0A834G6F5_RHOSS|nr:hypothetical protein RHSIM_Rhsim11G0018100 [Rhododendron simsii]